MAAAGTFAGPSDIITIESQIVDILNVGISGEFSQEIDEDARTIEAITAARRNATWDVLGAIANTPDHGYHGLLCADVPVEHGAALPGHLGEPGVPNIIPFEGATAIPGKPASLDEIASIRNEKNFFSFGIAHDQADSNGFKSSDSCRYEINKGVLHFTGKTATVPMIPVPENAYDTWIDEHIPIRHAPAVVKLSIQYLVKLDDNLAAIAPIYTNLGLRDLAEIQKGSLSVPPVPRAIAIQKQGDAATR